MPDLGRLMRLACAVSVLFLAIPRGLGAQEAAEPEAPTITTGALELRVGGRVQTLFSTTTAAGAEPALWEMRRTRLELTIRAGDVVSGRLAPEFAGSTIALRDAFVVFEAVPGLELLAGQAFRPFGRIPQVSSVRMLPIERGARIRGAGDLLEHHTLVTRLGYADRDVGIQLRGRPPGAPLGFSYAAGVTNGPLRGETAEATYQAAGQASVTPLPLLRLGASWSRRDFEEDVTGGEPCRLRSGSAFSVDAAYGAFEPGPHLILELAAGDLDPFTGSRFRAAQGWAAYRIEVPAGPTHIEPVLRVSYGSVDDVPRAELRAGLDGTLMTPGLNFYFGPLNRIMLNLDLWRPRAGPREQSFKALFQLAF